MTELGLDEITALVDCGLREGMLVDYLDRTGHGQLVRGLDGARAERAAARAQVRRRRAPRSPRAGARLGAVRWAARRRRARLRRARARASRLRGLPPRHRHLPLVQRSSPPHLLPDPQRPSARLHAGRDRDDGRRRRSFTARGWRRPAPGFAALEPADRATVRLLSVLLRLAERLDHSHAGSSRTCDVRALDAHGVELGIETAGDAISRSGAWAAVSERSRRRSAAASSSRLRAPRPAPPARA